MFKFYVQKILLNTLSKSAYSLQKFKYKIIFFYKNARKFRFNYTFETFCNKYEKKLRT